MTAPAKSPDEIVIRAPGRAEVLGNHTDSSGGLVIGMAIERGVTARIRANEDGRLIAKSDRRPDTLDVALDQIEAALAQGALPQWGRRVAGIWLLLQERGLQAPGAEIEFTADLPIGAGLASSAALEVAAALALLAITPRRLTPPPIAPMAIAQLVRDVEHRYAGVHSGLLDPATILLAQPDTLIYLDCDKENARLLPAPAGCLFGLIKSGITRDLAASAYNEVPADLEDVARALGGRLSSELPIKELERVAGAVPARAMRRARHVVSENARVAAAANALADGASAEFGALMFASHDSSRDLLGNSCIELDTLVELARIAPGCLGARLTGAGWGGATINLVRAEHRQRFVDYFAREGLRHFGRPLNVLWSRAVGGALTRA